MPELPEVETVRSDLSPILRGRRIINVDIVDGRLIRWPSEAEFAERLRGQTIVELYRRGKYLFFRLSSGDTLVVHRGMSGNLLLRRQGDSPDRYWCLTLGLEGGQELRFTDARRFGRISLLDQTRRTELMARLGPEPLDGEFTPAALAARLARRTALLKPLLMHQEIIAGIGNIYADEALFDAGIHPARRANTLTAQEIERLHGSIQRVLRQAVLNRGTTFRDHLDAQGQPGQNRDALQVFGKKGEPCPRCASTIQRTVLGGRGTSFCPQCQRL